MIMASQFKSLRLPFVMLFTIPVSLVGIVLVAPSYGERRVHTETDLGTVVVTGTPGELLLYSFGRRGAAQVELTGSAEALTAL